MGQETIGAAVVAKWTGPTGAIRRAHWRRITRRSRGKRDGETERRSVMRGAPAPGARRNATYTRSWCATAKDRRTAWKPEGVLDRILEQNAAEVWGPGPGPQDPRLPGRQKRTAESLDKELSTVGYRAHRAVEAALSGLGLQVIKLVREHLEELRGKRRR